MTSSPFARQAIEFKTPRVLIRTGTPADADAYARYARDADNFPPGSGAAEPDMTTEAAATRLAKFARWTAAGAHGWVLLFSRTTGEFMGYGGYNCFEMVDDAAAFLNGSPSSSTSTPGEKKTMADLGIMLDHRFWGRGYGLEVLVGLVEWARREVGAGLFRTETEPGNEQWQALMERAELGGQVKREKASYDKDKEVLQWRWDDKAWEEARRRIEAKGRWIEIE